MADNFVAVDNISADFTETASLAPAQITKGPTTSIGVQAASQAYRADGKKGEELPVYRTLGQILHIKTALTMQYAARDVIYRFLERVYDGDAWRWIMEDLRYNRMNKKRYAKDDQYRLVVNYVFSVVNDYVDLLSKDPSIHVPVLYPADPSSQDHAALVEKTYYGFWYASKMERQRYDLAWYLALLGSAGIESTPDSDGIPKLLVKHPGSLYVRARFGRPDEILYIVERFFLDPDQIADAYGDAWQDNGMYMTLDTRSGQWIVSEDWTPNMTKIEGFIFHTPWEKTVVIQNRILDAYSVQFEEPRPVPYRIIPFIKRPGRAYGIGAAEQIWGLNQYLNQLYSQEANILAYAANPIMVVKEPTQVPANIPNDPGAVVSVGPQGDVKWLQWQGAGHGDLSAQMQRTTKFLQDISGMPETRYGGTKQSFVTGRAVEELNAPTQDRIASRYRLIAAELSAINEIAMWQFEKISRRKKVSLYGFDGESNTFSMEVSGKDINGYRRNIITWDNHDHADAVEVLQLVGANLLDKYSGLLKLGIREPQQVLKRIREDRLEDIEFARQLELAKIVPVSPQASTNLLPAQDQLLGAQGQQAIAEGLLAGATGQPAPGQPPLGAPGGPSGEGGTAAPAPNASPSPVGAASPSPQPSAQIGQAGAPIQQPTAAPGVHRSGFGPNANLHLAGQPGNFDQQHVTNDFMALPPEKIKGKVYLTGPITQGAAMKIDVFLTNGLDKKTLIDLLPQYKGHMNFTVGSKVPANAIDVTPKAFVAAPKNQQPGVGNVPQPLSPLEPKGGQSKNPPGLVLERGPGGIPTGYAGLPEVPPGQGAPSEVNP